MPSTLQSVKTGPLPASARKIREYLQKHVKPDAPYYSSDELLAAVKLCSSSLRDHAKPHLPGWCKRVGRFVWWSTPEHIKKL